MIGDPVIPNPWTTFIMQEYKIRTPPGSRASQPLPAQALTKVNAQGSVMPKCQTALTTGEGLVGQPLGPGRAGTNDHRALNDKIPIYVVRQTLQENQVEVGLGTDGKQRKVNLHISCIILGLCWWKKGRYCTSTGTLGQQKQDLA